MTFIELKIYYRKTMREFRHLTLTSALQTARDTQAQSRFHPTIRFLTSSDLVPGEGRSWVVQILIVFIRRRQETG